MNRDASSLARGVTGLTDGARWVAGLESNYLAAEILERVKGEGEGAEIIAARLRCVLTLSVLKRNYSPPLRDPVRLCRHDDEAFGGALHALDPAEEEMYRRYLMELGEARAKSRRSSGPASANSSTKNAQTPPKSADDDEFNVR
jgi:hypothetical protein